MSASSEVGLPLGQILIGDVRQRLSALPTACVDTIITSPPYYGLRDYGHEHQLGLETDVQAWVASLVDVCREFTRVLKPGGSLWLNLGDSYSIHAHQGAPRKSLLLGPQRLAIALSEDGWVLRNQVIWAKTNPMPSSVGDRLSCTYEVLLLLVRSQGYFFDLDAIRQPLITKANKRPRAAGYRYLPDSAVPPVLGFDDDRGLAALKIEGRAGHPLGKNPGDVWQLPTAGYRGAHFATFPMALIERPLLATCPEKVCVTCGMPWLRERVNRSQTMPTLEELQPDCDCRSGTTAGVVLDPFMGAGTTALVAEMHGRDWIGIELNPEYAAMADQRLSAWRATHPKKHVNGEQDHGTTTAA